MGCCNSGLIPRPSEKSTIALRPGSLRMSWIRNRNATTTRRRTRKVLKYSAPSRPNLFNIVTGNRSNNPILLQVCRSQSSLCTVANTSTELFSPGSHVSRRTASASCFLSAVNCCNKVLLLAVRKMPTRSFGSIRSLDKCFELIAQPSRRWDATLTHRPPTQPLCEQPARGEAGWAVGRECRESPALLLALPGSADDVLEGEPMKTRFVICCNWPSSRTSKSSA